MITEELINMFKKYDGNIDNWARNSSKKEKLIITDDDWYLLDSLLQDLLLVKKGLTSTDFNSRLNINIVKSCKNKNTISKLKKLNPTS